MFSILLNPKLSYSQIEFGQYSEEELSLTQVSFEPDARIVTLWEEANSYFKVTGLHTNYHFRGLYFGRLSRNHDFDYPI